MVKINTVSQKTYIKSAKTSIGRLKTTEPTTRGSVQDIGNASLVPYPSVGQSRRAKLLVDQIKINKVKGQVTVPVLNFMNKPLMPCHPARARELLKKHKAVRQWHRGIFCIKLLNHTSDKVQSIVVGIDPGSKREAMTVQSKYHTYLNIFSYAITHVKERIKLRRHLRKARRFRKTPCRTIKYNRNNDKHVSPSTRARWQIKLNIIKFLCKLYPISNYVIEDIKAKTKKSSTMWNKNFSPLEVGKDWFYNQMNLIGEFILKRGYDTFNKRNELQLNKSNKKLSISFDSHNVDSWTLASFITKKDIVDNVSMFCIIPFQFRRRSLHMCEPIKGGFRKRNGGSMSFDFKRGSVVKHPQLGYSYIGGYRNKNKISLHDMKTGDRLTRKCKYTDIKFYYCSPWKTNFFK